MFIIKAYATYIGLLINCFFVIFLKFLGIKTVAFYDRKPLK